MKKNYYFAALGLLVASCASDEIVDNSTGYKPAADAPISFVTSQKNITRATKFQKAGHYNFGVFGYKNTDVVHNIMANYLVGYYDVTNAYSAAGTTIGDPEELVDGQSYWMYEGLGSAEFTGTFAGQQLVPGTQYASNVANQYLRYWDLASDYTCFYAYAPYVNTVKTGKEVTYVDGQAVGTSNDTYVMTIPNGTLKHGYDKEDEFEFMYASTKVTKDNYGHDVPLNFKRLNAKVNIKFWEDIAGYDVRIIDVSNAYSVSAVPAIKNGTSGLYGYKLGKIYSENGAKIQFSAGAYAGMKQYEGTTISTPLNFAAPTAAKIGTNRLEATPSATTYFAIPKGSTAGVLSNTADKYTDAGTLDSELDDTGLTFHVSYELISTTGEVITVKDATVFVPTDYTNWAPNTHYTYIFKITKNSNGTTDSTDTPNPEDPEVPTEIGLYPIIFDNCTVEEWQTVESEYVISEGTSLAYHDVQLSTYSVNNGTATNITVTVTDNDKFNGHSIDYTKVTVTGPDATVSAWYDNATHNISVPATATAGVYTVTYTCTLPTGIQYNNHPLTWTEKFVVNHAYKVKTNLTEVGTHSLADTKLVISTNMDNAGWENATDVTGLSIEYPVNTVDNKVKVQLKNGRACVVVDKGATPGKYRLIYTVKVEGIDVKVAHYDFDVKDYQFALNYANVYNQVGGTTITPTAPAGAVFEYELTDPSGNTTSFTGGIAIPNDSEEGTWTVTGTMHGTTATASKVQYNATFTVLNQYAVTLAYNNASATALNTAEGASNSNDYGTNYIVIASTKNGNADYTDDVTAANMLAKYAVSGLVRDTDYKIELVAESAGTPAYVKLKVNKNVPAGNYKVVYTGQTTPDTKTAEATFTIQK